MMDIKEDYQVCCNKFFDKKIRSGARAIRKREVNVNEMLAQELQKPVITKFKRRKVYVRFRDNIG